MFLSTANIDLNIKTLMINNTDKVNYYDQKAIVDFRMKSKQSKVILSVEVNEQLYECIQEFLAENPQWNQQLLLDASMSMFLMQNDRQMPESDYQTCSATYLKSVVANQDRHDHN